MSKTPLVVDLDGTLTRSDTLLEALVFVALRRPQHLWKVLSALLGGRYSLKHFISEIAAYDPETVPLRSDLVDYLREERKKGREIYLVTAAHQSVAEAVGERLPLFERIIASSDGVNLKGPAKRRRLEEVFPDGFVYAGNDRSDLDVWQAADGIILVATSPSVSNRARALGKPIEREFPEKRAGLAAWARLLRVHQWSKNLLIFVPWILDPRWDDWGAFFTTFLGFIAFSLIASATYVVNDLSDLSIDRHHPTKKNRPIANGDIPIVQAALVAGILGLAGFGLALLVQWQFALLALGYVSITLLYSLMVKSVALIDVFFLAMLYTSRIVMGMSLIGSATSYWLLVFSLFFFYSLSMAKRHVEIVRADARGLSGKIKGRGYRVEDAPFTLAVGLAAGVTAIVVLLEYVVNDAYPVNSYRSPDWLWLMPFLVFLWLTRVWLKGHRGELTDDPVIFALKDRVSWAYGALVLLCFGLALL